MWLNGRGFGWWAGLWDVGVAMGDGRGSELGFLVLNSGILGSDLGFLGLNCGIWGSDWGVLGLNVGFLELNVGFWM